MKPKVLLVVVLVLVVLMLVAFSLSAGRSAAGSGPGGFDLNNANWAITLRNWLTRGLAPDQLVNVSPDSCRPSATSLALAPGTTCRATIIGSDDATRQLKLRLTQGDAVRVVLEQPRALTVDLVIERQATTLDIYKDADLRDASLLITDCILPAQKATQEGTPAPKTPANCLLALD